MTSERENNAIIKLFNPKSITVLPNFVKLPGKKQYPGNKPSGCFKLLFFSRVEEKKGLDILLSALATVTFPYSLTVAGDGDKDYIESLKKITENNHIDDKINWAGFYSENKFDLLHKHDLFVLPSHDENFGNAVIESLGVGTPVLISEQVGLADYVKRNNLGWICHTNAASVSWAINDIIKNQEIECRRIRNDAPGIIDEDFNEKNLVKKYINMYQQLVKQ